MREVTEMDEKDKNSYHWYPGHMTKAVRMMKENMVLIDLVIELADARIPISSRNPDIESLGAGKSRIVLLNKADLADAEYNRLWTDYFKSRGDYVLEINAKSGAGIKAINGLVQEACREKIARDKKRGILNRPVRAMVAGIPNVGKSTFINSFAGRACAKTGNKPGVTKGKQWIRLNKSLELLDTPGILWPKFEDPVAGRNLAFIGSMNDEIIVTEKARYGVKWRGSPAETLEGIADSRGCILKGQKPDIKKASGILLDDFRSGRLGRITLERP